MSSLLAWWRARRIKALRDNAYYAAAAYQAARARYENALMMAGKEDLG